MQKVKIGSSYGWVFIVLGVLYFGLFTSTAYANFEVDWYRQFGGTGNDYGQDIASDGSVFVVGSVTTPLPGKTQLGPSDAFIRRYDEDGNILWTDQFGTTAEDRAVSVSTDDFHVMVVGVTNGTLPNQTSQGEQDIFIRTYDYAGNLLLTKQIGTPGTDEPASVVGDSPYFYLAGLTSHALNGQTPSGSYDVFVQKIHALGNHQWTRQFGTVDSDRALGVFSGPTLNGVYVVGTTQGSLPGFTNQGSADMFIRKYDVNGVEKWTDQFGSGGYDLLFNVIEYNGSVYVVGDVEGTLPGETGAGDYDGFLRSYDATDGSVNWTKQFGTTGFDEAYDLAVDDTGIYVAGFVEGALPGQTYTGTYDLYIRKYDYDGNELFTKQIGTTGADGMLGLAVEDGYAFMGGYTDGSWPGYTSSGGNDIFLIRMSIDSDGDNIYDAVDTDWANVSVAFANGETYGSVVTSGDQLISIKDSMDTPGSISVTADPSGGSQPAVISACGISTFYVDAGDELTITCGSITYDILAGDVEVVLYADDGRVAESTLSAGNGLTFEANTGSVSAPTSNTSAIVLTAGNETVTLAPGNSDEMPSDMPIAVSDVILLPAVVPIGSSTVLSAVITSPVDETSTITGAEYWIDGGSASAMNPVDGSFDAETEAATVDLGVFSEAGVHEVCVRGFDSVDNVSETACALLAVYDTSGGYVTGGGQIDSPAGAYTADSGLTGTAHFGFVAEYEEGANTPTGNTQFRFQAGDLKFKSTSYDWLVVAGARAQYKGVGSIDKQDGYRFMLTAIDGKLLANGNGDDAFRMKIWDETTGQVIYDNELGTSDSSTPATELTHGSVVIHRE